MSNYLDEIHKARAERWRVRIIDFAWGCLAGILAIGGLTFFMGMLMVLVDQ